jgi:hypothetical protein
MSVFFSRSARQIGADSGYTTPPSSPRLNPPDAPLRHGFYPASKQDELVHSYNSFLSNVGNLIKEYRDSKNVLTPEKAENNPFEDVIMPNEHDMHISNDINQMALKDIRNDDHNSTFWEMVGKHIVYIIAGYTENSLRFALGFFPIIKPNTVINNMTTDMDICSRAYTLYRNYIVEVKNEYHTYIQTPGVDAIREIESMNSIFEKNMTQMLLNFGTQSTVMQS